MPWFSRYKCKYPAFSTFAMGKFCRVKSSLPPPSSDGKASACNEGDMGSTTGSGRSPGGGNGNPQQYSCLGNPVDRGARQGTVHGIAESDTAERVTQKAQSEPCPGSAQKGFLDMVVLKILRWAIMDNKCLFWSQLQSDLPGLPGGLRWGLLPIAGAAGSVPGRGAKIPHVSWPESQNIKEKQHCNKFNKENDPHQRRKS